MELLVTYPWPGNVRELEHAIERLMVTCETNKVGAEHLPFVISQAEVATASAKLASTPTRIELGEKLEFEDDGLDLPRLTEEIERKAIEEALRRTDGVITEAARTLKITRRMLRYKMDKLGIASPATSNNDSSDDTDDSADGAASA